MGRLGVFNWGGFNKKINVKNRNKKKERQKKI